MNFIIISSIDWKDHWQLHHHLADSLSNDGHKVLFIENTGVRKPRIKDIGRIFQRLKERFKTFYGFTKKKENLYIYTPLSLPFPYSRIITFINSLLIIGSINKWMKSIFFRNPIVISFLPTPLVQNLISNLNPFLSIYYCANNMPASSNLTKPLFKWENKFFSQVDLVLSISEEISKKANKFNKNIYKISPGVNFERFHNFKKDIKTEDELGKISTPVIGYIGALGRVLDQELLIKIALEIPESNLLLVGPKFYDISPNLKKLKNVFFINTVSHDRLPQYINKFNVCIIPYKVNDFTNSVYCCKLNEYLSLGKPVVSTNMNEIKFFLEKYPDSIYIGNNKIDFLEKVKSLLYVKETKEKIDYRITVAKNNSWQNRYNQFKDIIKEAILDKEKTTIAWKENLNRFVVSSRIKFFKFSIIFLILYFVFFKSPLMWFIGDNLVYRDMPEKSDAIVVFTGYGYASYNNLGYQKRALDALNYYNKGYSDLIIVSAGREQTLSDAKLIKIYLSDQGIREDKIIISSKYPTSTYENIKIISNYIDELNINSILFITAPYHSLRSKLIWEKYKPDLKLITPRVYDTPEQKTVWGIKLKSIKVILYEYLSIVYNYFLGRI